MLFWCSLFLCVVNLWANPFEIDFPQKKILTQQDYMHVQAQLGELQLLKTLDQIFPFDIDAYSYLNFYEDFIGRCFKGVSQILIDPAKGRFPIQKLEKIGRGGDCCVVCCAPFDGLRSELILSIADHLRACGFNGHFYYRIGGFPNPTGEEIRYAGVPYCFKIFMMREAQGLGFNKVMWVDSSIVPLRDPTPLFEWIESSGAFINGWEPLPDAWQNIVPFTHELLSELTGTDVLKVPYINTIIFGLKMDSPKVRELIEEYYTLVRIGYPFCSCFPEEFVLTALMGGRWSLQPYPNIVNIAISDTPGELEQMRDNGWFFYNRKH